MWQLIVLLVVAVALVAMYNSLVRLREQADNAWSDIDVQLQRRHDLIPNLVETVKGYASHEKDTLERVIQARNQAVGAQGPAAQAQAEGALSGALRGLFALAEDYPDLKAADNFRELQQELSETEEQVAQARRYYNAVVRDLNTKTQTFPSVLIARSFGFEEREFFEVADEEVRPVPKVSFGDADADDE